MMTAWRQREFRDSATKLLDWYVMYPQPEHIICASPCTVLGLQHKHLMEGHWWIIIYLWQKTFVSTVLRKQTVMLTKAEMYLTYIALKFVCLACYILHKTMRVLCIFKKKRLCSILRSILQNVLSQLPVTIRWSRCTGW